MKIGHFGLGSDLTPPHCHDKDLVMGDVMTFAGFRRKSH